MISNHNHAAIRNIRTALTAAIGGKLPAPVAKAYADLDVLTSAALASAPTRQQVNEAAADAILAGHDPYTDTTVRELAALAAIAPEGPATLAWGITGVAFGRVHAAIEANDDTLAALIKATADKAGATLAKAHAVLGDLELNDAENIIRLGPAGAEAWIDAKAALKALDLCVSAWQSLTTITTIPNPAPTFLLADLDLDTIEKVGRKANAWAIVKAGGTIDLATRTTAKQRPEAYAKALTARDNASAGAFQQAWGRSHGSAPIHV